MKKFLLILLSFFLFSCSQNISGFLQEWQNSDLQQEGQSFSGAAIFSENITFERWEMQNFLKNSHKKIILGHTHMPRFFKTPDSQWEGSHYAIAHYNGLSHVDFTYNADIFNSVDEILWFIQTNSHTEVSWNILRLNGDFTDEEILQLFQFLSQDSTNDDFVVIEWLQAKHLKNSQILEKYHAFQSHFASVFPAETRVNFEINSAMQMPSEQEIVSINDAEKIFIELIYTEPQEWYDFGRTFERRFDNLADFEDFLKKNNNPIERINIWKDVIDKHRIFYPISNSPQALYSDEIFAKIFTILQNHAQLGDKFSIIGLKKVHFEKQDILELLANFDVKNLEFVIEQDSSFELRKQFYEKLLQAKAQKTVLFSSFSIGVDSNFCHFVDENEDIKKIVNKNDKPYLFCLASIYGQNIDAEYEKIYDSISKENP